MQRTRNALWLSAVCLATGALAPAALAAPIFTDLYVFGDSLSDTGNNEIVAPGGDIPGTDFTYGDNGRFSNGRVWAEYLSENLGLSSELEPSRAGGNNYAHGGASIDYGAGPETGLLTQYQHYLAGQGAGGSDPDALYVVWAGGNDLRVKIGPGSDPFEVISQSMAGYQGMLLGLIEAGAEHVMVPNIPNLGRTPEAMAAGVSEQATQLAWLWNSSLDGMLQELSMETSATIYAFDTFGFLESVFADAHTFGFTNLTEPCSSMEGNQQISCANPEQYIFWDSLHLTTAVHELLGAQSHKLILARTPAQVPLPATVWLLLPGLLLLRLRRS